MFEGDIVYDNARRDWPTSGWCSNSRELPFKCTLETQNFRPPEEKELTFSAYGYQGTEVMGVELKTKKVTNYSNAPDQYDEPRRDLPRRPPYAGRV